MGSLILAGDSLAVGLYQPLQRHLPSIVSVAQDGRCAKDAQHIPADASMVIVSLGTNDADARAPAGWEQTYAERLHGIMCAAPAAHFLWLLPPAMGEAGREFFVDQRRRVIRDVAVAAHALHMEPWPVSDYQNYYQGQQIRDDDGIHFTAQGYALWAHAIQLAFAFAIAQCA